MRRFRWCFVAAVIASAASSANAAETGDATAVAQSVGPAAERLEQQPCGGRMQFFTTLPSPLSSVRGIVPLGSLNPGHAHTLPKSHIHMYIVPVDPADPLGTTIEVPLNSPGRLALVAVERGPEAYTMQLKPCAEVTLAFDHVRTLAPALAAKIGDFSSGVCIDETCIKRTHIEIDAGEPLGTGGVENLAFDLDLIDLRLGPLPYARPERYALTEDLLNSFPPELRELAPLIAPQRLHEFCPLDYFIPPLQKALYGLLGSYDGSVKRTLAPRCGEHMQDRGGTAQGNWFEETDDNAFFDEPRALALVHDEVDPALPVFSISNSIAGWPPEVRSFSPVNSLGLVNRDFGDIVPGDTYCYENLRNRGGSEPGIVLLETFASGDDVADRVRIERLPEASSCGSGPWTFGPAAVVYQR